MGITDEGLRHKEMKGVGESLSVPRWAAQGPTQGQLLCFPAYPAGTGQGADSDVAQGLSWHVKNITFS